MENSKKNEIEIFKKSTQEEMSFCKRRIFIIPEIVEVDISKLDNVMTCACTADDANPY
jgi:hypothetical protein